MPNYYPPATSAGGGTPDDNTVTSAKIVDGAIVNADINAGAAIAYSKLNLGTSIVNADINAAAAIAYSKLALTGAILNADLAGSIAYSKLSLTGAILNADLAGSIAANKVTGTAVTAADTATVTNAMLAQTLNEEFWTSCFASFPPAAIASSTAQANANDMRWMRVVMGKAGTLTNVATLFNTTGGTNGQIVILDDGQANGTHTVRTALALSGNLAIPAGGAWMNYAAPGLTVTKGQSMVFGVTMDGTVAKVATGIVGTSLNSMPSGYLSASGAGTVANKLTGSALAANVPTTTSGGGSTITDGNMVAATGAPLFIWQIT